MTNTQAPNMMVTLLCKIIEFLFNLLNNKLFLLSIITYIDKDELKKDNHTIDSIWEDPYTVL